MKTLANTVVSVVVTFLVSAVLSVGLGMLVGSQASVVVGPSIVIGGQTYVSVDIANHSEEILDGIWISVPGYTSITQTIASAPLRLGQVSDTTGTGVRKRLEILGVEPRQATQLLVPIADHSDAYLVEVVNPQEKKLSVQSFQQVRSRFEQVAQTAAVSVGVTTLLYGVSAFWTYSQTRSLEKTSDQLRKQFAENEERFQALTGQFERAKQETDRRMARWRVSLLRRIRDYDIELQFWRHTIRKVLYSPTERDGAAEKLIDLVTDSLRTYTTRMRSDDVSGGLMMAEIIADQARTDGRDPPGV